jgi:phenylacetate-CoA ligase
MRWARFFDERVETMPPQWLRRLEDEHLADQVQRLRDGSSLYAERLEAAGYVEGVGDLDRVRPLSAAEVAAAQARFPPFGELACADPVDVVRACEVTGPDATPLVTAFTDRDLRVAAETGARGLWAAGLRPNDVVLDLVLEAGTDPIEVVGATAVRVRGLATAEILDRWPRLAPTALITTPAQAFELASEARARGQSPHALALSDLLVAARPGDDERDELEDLWGARVSFFWGEPAIGDVLAAECERRAGLHVLGQGAVLVELLDGATGDRVDAGREGEAVVSHLDREATPLLRLRTGISMAVLAGECPCGRTGYRVALRG